MKLVLIICAALIGAAIVGWYIFHARRHPSGRIAGRWSTDRRRGDAGPFKAFIASVASLNDDMSNETWMEWVDFQPRDIQAFNHVVHGRYKLEFKQRALLLLLAPQTDLVPVFSKEFERPHIYYMCLENLPPELHEFAVTLIDVSVQALDERDPEYENALTYYQVCIETLFPQVSDSLRERLYGHFLLLEVFPYYNQNSNSCYRPWSEILRADIGDEWRRRFDLDMRAIILREMHGKATPRVGHEDAFCCYLNRLNSMAIGLGPRYNVELYAEQLAFALSVAEKDACWYEGREAKKQRRSRYVCTGNCLQCVLGLLDRETYADLRCRLIVNTWLYDPMHITLDTYLWEAQEQLNEIREAHPDIAAIIQTAVADYEHRHRERLARLRAQEQQQREADRALRA